MTSQYRKERLRDTPISESTMSAEEPARRNVTDLSSLAGRVPRLFIGAANATNGTNLISIRGISGLAAAGASQAVAVYLDGVYLPRPDAPFFGLEDVERIEVLRVDEEET